MQIGPTSCDWQQVSDDSFVGHQPALSLVDSQSTREEWALNGQTTTNNRTTSAMLFISPSLCMQQIKVPPQRWLMRTGRDRTEDGSEKIQLLSCYSSRAEDSMNQHYLHEHLIRIPGSKGGDLFCDSVSWMQGVRKQDQETTAKEAK